jgi:protein SCO1
MSERKAFLRIIYWLIIVAMVLAIFIAFFVFKHFGQSRASLPVLGQIPEFQFTESHGQPFGLTNLKGKICVVDFMFTRCPELCPMMSAKLADLYREFAGSDSVQFVSITVDPDYDSLPVLQKYGLSFGVNDNRWVFLRGPIDDVVRLSEKGFMIAADNLPEGHSSKFILLDQMAQIRGYYDSYGDVDIDLLKRHIRKLSKNIQ